MAKKASQTASPAAPKKASVQVSGKRAQAKPAGPTPATASENIRAWLMKSEPDVFSIEDLKRAPRKTTYWDGVRNYQARNMMRDYMQIGDRVLFYHSNCDPPAIVGTAKIVKTGYPDHTAWDPEDPHYDPKSSADSPTWYMVDIQLDAIFQRPLSLEELRSVPELKDMELLRRGSRLSVQPVRERELNAIIRLAAADQ